MFSVLKESGFVGLRANMKNTCTKRDLYDPSAKNLPLEVKSKRMFKFCPFSELTLMENSGNVSDYLVVSLIDNASGWLIGFGIGEVVDTNRLNYLFEKDYGSTELNATLHSPVLVIRHIGIIPEFRSNNYSYAILKEFARLGLPTIVNTTRDSEEFWMKKGFSEYRDSSWLVSPNFFSVVTYRD